MFLKTPMEEVNLLRRDDEQEIFYYICCHGIASYLGQKMMLKNYPKWIRLQEITHAEIWHVDLQDELSKQGYGSATDMSDEKCKDGFMRWLHHKLMVSPLSFPSEKEYGITSQLLLASGVRLSPALSCEEEIKLLLTKDWDKIRDYSRRFHPHAEKLFFETAPVELIFGYIRHFRPQTDECECAILKRNNSYLSWQLISYYSLRPQARKLVKMSGNMYAWKWTVLRCYGFDSRLEQKFGSIRATQAKLEKSFNKKYFA